jgi:hypothetical protein
LEVELEASRISSNFLGSGLCADHEFGLGVALAVPSGHKQNFVAEGISKYVVDVGRAIEFKETSAARIWPFRQTSVERQTQFGKLLGRVFPKILDHSR